MGETDDVPHGAVDSDRAPSQVRAGQAHPVARRQAAVGEGQQQTGNAGTEHGARYVRLRQVGAITRAVVSGGQT